MTLVRWNPTREMTSVPRDVFNLQSEFNKMVGSFFSDEDADTSVPSQSWIPAVDIMENDDKYIANMELPGVRKEDVSITMLEQVLTIRGEKKQEKKEGKDGSVDRIERSYGSFQRSFTLPATVRSEAIVAEFKDGILTVTMPKAEEKKPKQIEVKVK